MYMFQGYITEDGRSALYMPNTNMKETHNQALEMDWAKPCRF